MTNSPPLPIVGVLGGGMEVLCLALAFVTVCARLSHAAEGPARPRSTALGGGGCVCPRLPPRCPLVTFLSRCQSLATRSPGRAASPCLALRDLVALLRGGGGGRGQKCPPCSGKGSPVSSLLVSGSGAVGIAGAGGRWRGPSDWLLAPLLACSARFSCLSELQVARAPTLSWHRVGSWWLRWQLPWAVVTSVAGSARAGMGGVRLFPLLCTERDTGLGGGGSLRRRSVVALSE